MSDEAPRRYRILRTAEKLFIHYGPAKTTIADIAKACGIGVGTVYLDFSSKEAILHELAAQKSRAVAARMKTAADSAGTSTAARLVAALKARVEAFLDLANAGQHACDLVRHSNQVTTFAARSGEEPRAVLRELIASGVASGELAGQNEGAIVETIEIAFAALSPPELYRIERSVAEARAERLAQLVVHGMCNREQAADVPRLVGGDA